MPTASLPVNPAVNYSTLKQELATSAIADAGGVTVAQHAAAGRYQDAANLLNTAGTVAGATVPTGVLPVAHFQGAVVAAEFMALPVSQRDDLLKVLDGYQAMYGGVPLNDPGTWQAVIPTYFPSTAAVQPGHTANTYQQLQSLQSRPCSRAESLFGAGVALIWQDVAQARDYTA